MDREQVEQLTSHRNHCERGDLSVTFRKFVEKNNGAKSNKNFNPLSYSKNVGREQVALWSEP